MQYLQSHLFMCHLMFCLNFDFKSWLVRIDAALTSACLFKLVSNIKFISILFAMWLFDIIVTLVWPLKVNIFLSNKISFNLHQNPKLWKFYGMNHWICMNVDMFWAFDSFVKKKDCVRAQFILSIEDIFILGHIWP